MIKISRKESPSPRYTSDERNQIHARIIDLMNEGLSKREIKRQLNADEVPGPDGESELRSSHFSCLWKSLEKKGFSVDVEVNDEPPPIPRRVREQMHQELEERAEIEAEEEEQEIFKALERILQDESLRDSEKIGAIKYAAGLI